MINEKRILITGGSGFIGVNLVEYLISQGYLLINADRNKPVVPEQEKYWKKVDLLDAEKLLQLVVDFLPTHVVHLAARTDLKGQSIEDYAVNTAGTENLIESFKQVSTLQHVLFTSSMLVCRPGYIPRFDTDFSPATIYGESKVRMEEIVRSAVCDYRWNLIRPTSIWGPWFGSPYKDFFDRVLDGKMYNIGGRLSAVKTYGFVLNAVLQIEKLLFNQTIDKQVFYIGDEPAINIKEWANIIANKAGITKPPVIHYLVFRIAALLGDTMVKSGKEFPMTSFRLKNMTTNNILPLENLKKITGESRYNLNDAIDITLDWIKKQ